MAVAFVREGGSNSTGELVGDPADVQTLTFNVVAAGHAMGNTLVVCVQRESGSGVCNVSDSQGNTYTLQKKIGPLIGDFGVVEIWTAYLAAALAGGGGGDTITVTDSSATKLSAQIQEFSGVSSSSPVDVSAANSGTGGGGAVTPFVTLPTTGGERYLVAALGYHYIEPSDTPVPNAAWTAGQSSTWDYGPEDGMLRVIRRGPVAAGTYTASWTVATYTAFPSWAVVAIALQAAAGGGTPTAPSGLDATAVSASQINLSWTDNSSDETGFKIERSLDGVSYTQIATVAAGVTTYSNTGLTAATLYYYRVRAYNGFGNSAYSNADSATTTASGSGEPTTVPADPSNCNAEGIGESRIRVTWLDNAVDETGFKIERSPNGVDTWVQIGVAGADVTELTATGLNAATTYYFRVRAYNAVGNSGYSNVASATTLAAGQGAGVCPVERYATVGDVQRLIWSGHLAISDASEPNRAAVEDWLCDVTQWMDRQLAWKYTVPVTDTGDREVLRPICAALVAARCWQALVGRNPGQEARASELESEGLSRFVWNPGGLGSRLKGTASVTVASKAGQFGRSLLVLTNTPATGQERAGVRFPSHTFSNPDSEGGTPRRFSLSKEM